MATGHREAKTLREWTGEGNEIGRATFSPSLAGRLETAELRNMRMEPADGKWTVPGRGWRVDRWAIARGVSTPALAAQGLEKPSGRPLTLPPRRYRGRVNSHSEPAVSRTPTAQAPEREMGRSALPGQRARCRIDVGSAQPAGHRSESLPLPSSCLRAPKGAEETDSRPIIAPVLGRGVSRKQCGQNAGCGPLFHRFSLVGRTED